MTRLSNSPSRFYSRNKQTKTNFCSVGDSNGAGVGDGVDVGVGA